MSALLSSISSINGSDIKVSAALDGKGKECLLLSTIAIFIFQETVQAQNTVMNKRSKIFLRTYIIIFEMNQSSSDRFLQCVIYMHDLDSSF